MQNTYKINYFAYMKIYEVKTYTHETPVEEENI